MQRRSWLCSEVKRGGMRLRRKLRHNQHEYRHPFPSQTQRRSWLVRTGGKVKRGGVRLRRKLRDNERLLVVAISSMLMSVSHTALRPVLPLFAKVLKLNISIMTAGSMTC